MQLDMDATILEAISVTDLVANEQRWLETAVKCYPESTFERLVQYSTDRIGQFVSEKTQGICEVSAVIFGTARGKRVVFQMRFESAHGKRVGKAIRRLQHPVVTA